MQSLEPLVAAGSDYYVYMPSVTAMETFFYPLYIGHFLYQPGYSLTRESYDSFLLIYIQNGTMTVTANGQTQIAERGNFVLLDCYQPHSYSCSTGCETLWCHFDGSCARGYYRCITERLGMIFSLAEPTYAVKRLQMIYQVFADGQAVREPLLSRYLTDILTDILLDLPGGLLNRRYTGMAEDIAAYMNEHMAEPLSIEQLAGRAGLSPYHFIRTFKKETGFTPHDYLLNIRLNTARYLLKNSTLPVKEICFSCGFSSESIFCNAFKKRVRQTPGQYRNGSGREPEQES